jgi:hypothetical protein
MKLVVVSPAKSLNKELDGGIHSMRDVMRGA